MKLPNGDLAVVDPRKIVEYCLSPDHEDGQHKSRLFASILGLNIDNADQLIEVLRNTATAGNATLGEHDQYGQRYVIDFEFAGRSGSAKVRSAWIIRQGETVPRLVTCYIL